MDIMLPIHTARDQPSRERALEDEAGLLEDGLDVVRAHLVDGRLQPQPLGRADRREDVVAR